MSFVDVGFCLHPGGNVGDHPTYQNYYSNSSSTSLTVKQVMSDVNFVYFNSQHLFSQYLTKTSNTDNGWKLTDWSTYDEISR